jgi:hypothetical protein
MRAIIVAIDAPRPSMHTSGGKPTLVPARDVRGASARIA